MASGSVASSVVTAPHDKLIALLAQFAAPITHSVHKDIVGISPAPNGSNHLAIVGNDLSCVLEVGEQGISGEIPLKPGSSINAFNKFTQVCWCKADDTHYRVVAATATGGIYVWDPFSPGTRLITHRREISRINQIVVRPHEPNQFLTVSSNGIVKLWDLRDLGSSQVVYQRRGENFVNAQFNPFDNFDFVIAEESGSLNRIDVRSRASLDRTFAHTKGVKSMHWNPESRWLATAGSDKLIKVWDMQEARFRRNEQTIYTQGSLKSVRWRPGLPRELASCHSASDGLVYLWNLDRPLIPRAFIDCVDPVVDIVFRDSHKLWAVCERGLFRQTDFRRATITEDLFPRNKVHWSPRGDMVFLASRHHQRNPMDQALSAIPALPLESVPTQITSADLVDKRPDGRNGMSHSTTASMPYTTSGGSQPPLWSPSDTRPGYSAKTIDIPISNLLLGGSYASQTPIQRGDDNDDDGIEALPLNSESRRPSTSYRDAVIRPNGTPSPQSHLAAIGSSDPGASKGSDLGFLHMPPGLFLSNRSTTSEPEADSSRPMAPDARQDADQASPGAIAKVTQLLSQGLNAISAFRPLVPIQHMGMLKLSAAHYHFDARAFMYQAKYYAQDSKHPLFSCQKNAMTALQTGNYRACTTWHMLSTLVQSLDLLTHSWDPAALMASGGLLTPGGYRPHESPYYPPDHLAQHYTKPNQVPTYVPTRLHYPTNPPALQLPGHPRNYGVQRKLHSNHPAIPSPAINSAPAPGSGLARGSDNESRHPRLSNAAEQAQPNGVGKSAAVPTAHTVHSQPSSQANSQYPSCHSSVRLKSRPDSPLLTHTADPSTSHQDIGAVGSLQSLNPPISSLLVTNRHSHSEPAMTATASSDEYSGAANHKGQRSPQIKPSTRSRVEFQPDLALTLSDPITTDGSAFPFPMSTGLPRPSAMTAWAGPFASDSRRASTADNLQRAQGTRGDGSGPSALSSLMSPARLRQDPQTHASPLGSGVQLICDVMEFYASQGDVQMCVSIFFVFRPLIEPFVSRIKLSYWCADYVELLRRFKLHAIATDAGNRSQFTFLKKPTTQYSEIPTTCQFCSEIVMYSETGYWTCPSCHNIISRCVLCHLPIRGHIVWCRGCGHGGHVGHLTAWFQRHTSCPSGCGHECSVPFQSSLLPQA